MCTVPAMVERRTPAFRASTHSWINSPACGPMIWQPRSFPCGLTRSLIFPAVFAFGQGPVVARKGLLEEAVRDSRLCRPFFVQADACHLRVRVGAPADLSVVRLPREAKDRVGDRDPPLVAGDVGEGELAVHVAAGVDVGDVGPHPCIRGDPPGIERHAGGRETEPVGVRFASRCDEDRVARQERRLPRARRRGDGEHDGPAFPSGLNRLGPGQKDDPLRFEPLPEDLRDIGILRAEDLTP